MFFHLHFCWQNNHTILPENHWRWNINLLNPFNYVVTILNYWVLWAYFEEEDSVEQSEAMENRGKRRRSLFIATSQLNTTMGEVESLWKKMGKQRPLVDGKLYFIGWTKSYPLSIEMITKPATGREQANLTKAAALDLYRPAAECVH